MRLPDRPGADSVVAAEGLPRDDSGSSGLRDHPDHHSRDWYRDLAGRLAGLPDAHPSAWSGSYRADAAGARAGESDTWWRDDHQDPDEPPGEPDDRPGTDHCGYGESGASERPGQDSEPDGPAVPAAEPGSARESRPASRGPRRQAGGWREPGSPVGVGSPYRPWFSADGGAGPWFATHEDG